MRTSKILFVIMSVMCVCLISTSLVFAAVGGDLNSSISWSLNASGELRITGRGTMPNWDAIGATPWYEYNPSIKTVVIGSGITSIGNHSFQCLEHLENIEIPNTVKTIGEAAFNGCNKLKYVNIPDSVTTIKEHAFMNCGVTSITIGIGLTTIENTAFDINDVKTVYYMGGLDKWNTITGRYYLNDDYLIYVVEKGLCGNELLWRIDSANTLTVQGNGAMPNWTKASDVPWDKYRSSIRSIAVEQGITNIGNYAFQNCKYASPITIPNTVTNIGDFAFNGCSYFESIILPDSLTSIGYYGFQGCSKLKSINIPSSVTNIGNCAFANCSNLATITIPDTVGVFERHAFEGTAYYNNSNNWSNNVLYLGKHLLTAKDTLSGSYTIKSGTQTISPQAFYGCTKMTSVTIPTSVRDIGYTAFYRCTALTTVKIPSGITKIPKSMFGYCESLSSVTVPKSITEIEGSAFGYCRKLKDVYYDGTKADWEKINIYSYENSALINATKHYPTISVTEISLDKNNITMCVGEEYTLTASVLPIDATNKTVIWSSSDESVVLVENGVVTAKTVGNATITASSADGKVFDCCEVTVEVDASQEYQINSITIKDVSGNVLSSIPTGAFLATVSFTNVSSSEDTVIILAQYTNAGAFKGLMYIQTEDVPTGSTIKLSIPVDNSKGDVAKLKAFCWESFGSLTPMGNSASFPIE